MWGPYMSDYMVEMSLQTWLQDGTPVSLRMVNISKFYCEFNKSKRMYFLFVLGSATYETGSFCRTNFKSTGFL